MLLHDNIGVLKHQSFVNDNMVSNLALQSRLTVYTEVSLLPEDVSFMTFTFTVVGVTVHVGNSFSFSDAVSSNEACVANNRCPGP